MNWWSRKPWNAFPMGRGLPPTWRESEKSSTTNYAAGMALTATAPRFSTGCVRWARRTEMNWSFRPTPIGVRSRAFRAQETLESGGTSGDSVDRDRAVPAQCHVIGDCERLLPNEERAHRPDDHERQDIQKDGCSRLVIGCLLYTSDAADEEDSVDLGG